MGLPRLGRMPTGGLQTLGWFGQTEFSEDFPKHLFRLDIKVNVSQEPPLVWDEIPKLEPKPIDNLCNVCRFKIGHGPKRIARSLDDEPTLVRRDIKGLATHGARGGSLTLKFPPVQAPFVELVRTSERS